MKAEVKELTGLLRIVPQKHRMITVVGAGGKTTLIYLLARELTDAGYKVAVTTTTHMQAEGRYGFRPLGIPCEDGKIKGISEEFPGELLKEYDIVLVEGDGSRQLPMKFPADHEPVIPAKTDMVIGVAGAGAIGRTFREACHRYHIACAYFRCEPDEQIKVVHMAEALTSRDGQKKNVVCEYRYLVNQTDRLEDSTRNELAEAMQRREECGGMVALHQIEEKYHKTEGIGTC